MPWLFASPGHQHPWCSLCRIGSCHTWGRISTKCIISVWTKNINWRLIFMFPMKHLAHNGLIEMGSNQQKAVLTWAQIRWVAEADTLHQPTARIWKPSDNTNRARNDGLLWWITYLVIQTTWKRKTNCYKKVVCFKCSKHDINKRNI